MAVHLNHLNFRVRDLDRAAAFYGKHFGFVVEYPVEDSEGLLLRGPRDVILVIERGDPPDDPGSVFHLGFGVDSAAEVSAMRAQLVGGGAAEVERVETDDFCSVKVLDPDRNVVEIYWSAGG